jgi:hypothetical protein
MNRLRKLLADRPVMGWLVAGLLLALLGLSLLRLRRIDDNPYSLDRTTEMVTIRCRETGEEWTMPRGRMEQMLWDRPAPLDPSQGLPHPTTGRLTGFPKSDWETTIDRIGAERQEIASKRSRAGAPTGR